MMKTYETERLYLRVLDKTSAQLVLNYYNNNKSFLEEWEPKRNDEFFTRKYQEQLLKNELVLIENRSMLRLWIFKKDDNSKIIGAISFSNIIYGAFLSCHLGYKLDKDEINKGYMSEVIIKGIDIIFNEYGLHRIEANIMPKNMRSLKLIEKLGFFNEGLAVNYLKINGNWEDHIHLVLLNNMLDP